MLPWLSTSLRMHGAKELGQCRANAIIQHGEPHLKALLFSSKLFTDFDGGSHRR